MRVLVATDGSDGANQAAEWLTTLPLDASTEVLVVAAAELSFAALAAPPEPPLPLYDEMITDAATRAANDTRAILARRWPATEARVVHGDARTAIVEQAEEWRADLVAVGARGLGAIAGFFLGSVSTAVAHDATCPVLIVKGQPRGLETVVIGIDGSESAIGAVQFFATLPPPPTATVRLVGVVAPPSMPRTAPELVTPALQQAIDDLIADARRRIDAALAAAEAELRGKVARTERAMPVGLPADSIVAAANEAHAELIVIGARGLGPIKRLLVGSVSERVMHRAECPVLIVKQRAR